MSTAYHMESHVNVNCSHASGLTVFGETVVADSARSLRLLGDIEETISTVNWISDKINADARFAHLELECLQEKPNPHPMDQEGVLEKALLEGQEGIRKLYNIFIDKRQAARQDNQITSEDGIEEAYTRAIESAADLYNAIADLRWGIYEHDASLEIDANGPVLTTPEEIKAYLSEL